MSNANQKYKVSDVIGTEQFNIRLPIKYYVFTVTHLIVAIFCYMIFEALVFGLGMYLLLNLFFYRFFFTEKKNGDFYKPFFLKYGQRFYRKIRDKARGARYEKA